MSTQWRVSAGGAVGLDYNTLPTVAEMLDFNKEQLKEAFHDIRIMEGEALSLMHKKD